MAGVFAAFPYTRSEAIWRIGPKRVLRFLGSGQVFGDFGSLGLSTAVRLAASGGATQNVAGGRPDYFAS